MNNIDLTNAGVYYFTIESENYNIFGSNVYIDGVSYNITKEVGARSAKFYIIKDSINVYATEYWNPIGTGYLESLYKGKFNGNNYSISNLMVKENK